MQMCLPVCASWARQVLFLGALLLGYHDSRPGKSGTRPRQRGAAEVSTFKQNGGFTRTCQQIANAFRISKHGLHQAAKGDCGALPTVSLPLSSTWYLVINTAAPAGVLATV